MRKVDVTVIAAKREQNIREKIAHAQPVFEFLLLQFFLDSSDFFGDFRRLRIIPLDPIFKTRRTVAKKPPKRRTAQPLAGSDKARLEMDIRHVEFFVRADLSDTVKLVPAKKKNIARGERKGTVFDRVDPRPRPDERKLAFGVMMGQKRPSECTDRRMIKCDARLSRHVFFAQIPVFHFSPSPPPRGALPQNSILMIRILFCGKTRRRCEM